MARRHRDVTTHTLPIGQELRQLGLRDVAVPHHVHQPVARLDRPVEARDRVHEDVAVRQDLIGDCVVQGLIGLGAEVGFGDRPPPGDVPRVPPRCLREHPLP